MNGTFYTQSCVLLPSGEEYTLAYHLQRKEETGAQIFGITINLIFGADIIETSTAYAWSCPEKAKEYIITFSKNFLFPCHLQEIVDDL